MLMSYKFHQMLFTTLVNLLAVFLCLISLLSSRFIQLPRMPCWFCTVRILSFICLVFFIFLFCRSFILMVVFGVFSGMSRWLKSWFWLFEVRKVAQAGKMSRLSNMFSRWNLLCLFFSPRTRHQPKIHHVTSICTARCPRKCETHSAPAILLPKSPNSSHTTKQGEVDQKVVGANPSDCWLRT